MYVCVCVQPYEAMCLLHMYQSGLVIDKIPPVLRPGGASGTSAAAVEHMRLKCVRVPLAQPGGRRTIELSQASRPSFPPTSLKDREAPAGRN